MFRPNRIGTPVIRQPSGPTITATSWTIDQASQTSGAAVGTICNGTPLADFGEVNAYYQSTTVQALTGGNKSGIWAQFSATTPLNGDTIGFELIGSLWIVASLGVHIMPGFTEMNSAGPSNFSPLSARTISVASLNFQGWNNSHNTIHASTFKEQVILNKATAAGTYAFGFELIGGVTTNLSTFHASFGLRQLNDQQTIGYRDTRR